MRKSTRSISLALIGCGFLALIGSGLVISGCGGCGPRQPDGAASTNRTPYSGSGSHGYYSGGWYNSGGSAGGGGHGASVSPHGGFGSAGHAAGGS